MPKGLAGAGGHPDTVTYMSDIKFVASSLEMCRTFEKQRSLHDVWTNRGESNGVLYL